jgi:hypothetical protein
MRLGKYIKIATATLVAIGVCLIVLPFVLKSSSIGINEDLFSVIVGGGVSFISSAIINIIWAYNANYKMERANERFEKANARLHTMVFRALGLQTKIRREQRVNIAFESNNGRIIAHIEHSFCYNTDDDFGQDRNIEIFSDFRGDVPREEDIKAKDFQPAFYFVRIEEDHITVADWEVIADRDVLCNVENGKLYYKKETTLPPERAIDTKSFKFYIHNEYGLYDRLVWTFQEFSRNIVVHVVKGAGCEDIPFFFRINHPEVNEIVSENNPDDNLKLDAISGQIKAERLELRIKHDVLPYQGFEISWGVNEKKKTQGDL